MRIVKNLSVYTTVSFLQQGIAFPLAIIFSYYILPEQMGMLALFMLYISLLSIFMNIGSEGAITVAYFKVPSENYRSYFSSSLITPFLLFILFQLLFYLFRVPLSKFIHLPVKWLLLIPIASFTSYLPRLALAVYRMKEEAFKYAYLTLALTSSTLFSSLFFVIYFNLNWEGRALGILLSNILFFIIGFYLLNKSGLFTKQVKSTYVKDALEYGVPLIPHLIGTFIIAYSDQIFIEKMVGLDELGIYNMGYKVGSLVLILVVSFSSAYTPFLFESLKTPTERANKKLALIAYGLFLGLGIALFVLTLASPFLFNYLINEKYATGNQYVFWVGLGSLFYGGYALFSGFLNYAKKSMILAYLAVVNVSLNLILNYFLIKFYGAIGAAYATIISYFTIFVLVAYLTRNEHTIPYFDFSNNFKFLRKFLKEYRANL